jgi:hypothetical protein
VDVSPSWPRWRPVARPATAITATQLRRVCERLLEAGKWKPADPPILIVADAGYDVTRLAFLLAGLPVELLGRIRSDRVLRLPAPPRDPHFIGRPPKHGGEFALGDPATWPDPSTPRRRRPPGTAPRPRCPGTGSIPA